MSPLRQFRHGMRSLLHRDRVDNEISEEVGHYIEEATLAHMSRGMSRDAARRTALMEIGGASQTSERVRAYGWENLVETFAADVRFALRRLASAPGFTAVALLTLALGIGGTTAIFSAVNPILFKSLPYPDADRIAMIREQRTDGSYADGTYGMYRGIQSRSKTLSHIGVARPWQPTMTGEEQPERFDGQRVSYQYFEVLGAKPMLGRLFTEEDDRARGPLLVVLSESVWRRRFAADPSVVGRQVKLNDNDYTIIGVLPPEFRNVLLPTAEVWAPLQYEMTDGRAWGHHLLTIGRMREGVDTNALAAEMNRLGDAVLRAENPATYGDDVRWVTPQLQADLTSSIRPALLAVLAAMVLVLAIACVNVTNLLLARGVQRRSEFALRAALGAGRRRLIRQLLTESVLLSVLSGVLGMGIALAGIRILIRLSPPGLPLVDSIRLDGNAFAFGAALTTLIGVVFGLIPALHASGNEHRDLQSGSKRVAGEKHKRARSALVVAEVALALVLLVGSGLLLRSMQRLFSISPGFDPADVVTMQVQISGRKFDSADVANRFFADALRAVKQVPGVEAAAMTTQLPMSGDFDSYGVHFESSPRQTMQEDHSGFRYAVSPGYFETMGIPLRDGRTVSETDRENTPLVAMINESYAKRNFPGMNPIGQRLRIGPMDSAPFTIVGVVGDVKQMSLMTENTDAVYIPQSQWVGDRVMSLVVRAKTHPEALVPAIRQAIWSVDRNQPVTRVATLSELVETSAAERRFALMLFEAFALAALVLAAAGIYGVLSGSVAERSREIGVRTALGAPRASIIGLVLGEGFHLTVLGMGAGLVVAFMASRALGALLFNVSALDPATYISVVALLAVVSLFACAVPAWRAVRMDAVNTLRAD